MVEGTMFIIHPFLHPKTLVSTLLKNTWFICLYIIFFQLYLRSHTYIFLNIPVPRYIYLLNTFALSTKLALGFV